MEIDFAMILPGIAMLRVYLRPSFGSKTAVGFEVSTSDPMAGSGSRFRFCGGSENDLEQGIKPCVP